ncbi:MAG: hypothetical protein ACLR56_05985 [Oscillospiraceae bacterium]
MTVEFDIPLIRLQADCPEYRNTHIKLGHGYLLWEQIPSAPIM